MRISQLDIATDWEKMMHDVGRGKQYPETFLKAIEIFTRQIAEEIITLNTVNL